MENPTFEQLPQAIRQLSEKVCELKQIVLSGLSKPPEQDEWLDVQMLAEFLPSKPAPSTVYGWVSKRKIPHHKKGKNLLFLKSEINQWLKKGKVETIEESQEKHAAERDAYLSTRRKSR